MHVSHGLTNKKHDSRFVPGIELEHIASLTPDGVEDRRLANLTKTSNWKRTFEIRRVEGPPTWRMLKATEGEGVATEEMVFVVHGIIQNLDLPPFTERRT
jgi:hypothetical protein